MKFTKKHQYPHEDNASAKKNLQYPHGNSDNKNRIVTITMRIFILTFSHDHINPYPLLHT